METINTNDCTLLLLRNNSRCLETSISFTSMFDFSTNLSQPEQAISTLKPLISDEVTQLLEIVINIIGLYLTSLFGVAANIINLIVYGKQGLKDSITIGLFVLSLSDLILVTMPLVTASCHAAEFLMPHSTIDFPSIHYVSSGWMRNMTYSMSCFITAFLSLERCCCIILPFKVKSLFTRGKTTFIIMLVFLIHAACMLMLPAAFKLGWWPSANVSASNNMTRIIRVMFFERGEMIEVFNTTLMSLFVPTTTQIIVTICAAFLVKGLRDSASFRNEIALKGRAHTASSPSTISGNQNNPVSIVTPDTFSSGLSDDDGGYTGNYDAKDGKSGGGDAIRPKDGRSHLTSRDARLVKTMIFLVTILTACNIPFLVATFAWRTIPEMNIGRAYENTLKVSFSFVYLLGNLNASCNVFVYYHTSSNFRQVLNALFASCGGGKLGDKH